MTYEVIYRTGGTHHCTWRRLYYRYKDRSNAVAKAQEIERMGYKSAIRTTEDLERIGLPIGWNFDAVDWDNDEVTVTPYETVHIKRS